MTTRLHPFNKPLADLIADDLQVLRDVAEGWYVEYKSAIIPAKTIAKSISAFANQYGGFLFIGIDESRDGRNVAASFPGVASADIPKVESALKEAARNCAHPYVYYHTKVVCGPSTNLGLREGQAVVVVYVPQGPDVPYVHNDGRIYRRVGDSSEPRPETDRTALDLLWQRGHRARSRLSNRIEAPPTLATPDSPYLQLFISHDPLEFSERRYGMSFQAFVACMNDGGIDFDNCFSNAHGYVARHVGTNDAAMKLLTWDYDFAGHSQITVPIRWSAESLEQFLRGYHFSSRYLRLYRVQFKGMLKIIDLSQLLASIIVIVAKHRRLLGLSATHGPFFVKCALHGVGGSTPFIDVDGFIAFLENHQLPIVQDNVAILPAGKDVMNFINLSERQPDPPSNIPSTGQYEDVVRIVLEIFSALGIPGDVVGSFAHDLGTTHERAQQDR